MIKLTHLNKYYNRKKRNELHVLNDVSLSFETKGLVVLLGESGSGKTTLLNVLGGLDGFDKGTIDINDTTIKKYRSKVLDTIRNHHVGIIFQNYYLLPTETVHENIALTLRLVGITDTEELDKRIDYLLEAVNMKNYRHRKASQLSGGQQQRVAIARALAKNPSVILADEPTGNLDSKNTLEIMRIIKEISKEKLVIMVTHEKTLANYFADRIVEIEDGKVLHDTDNVSNGTLTYHQETNIYLKDFAKQQTLKEDALKIDYYSDTEDAPLDIKLILKNKTLYLDITGEALKKITILDESSEVKLLDAAQSSEETAAEAVKPFQYEKVIDESKKQQKPPTIVTFKNVLISTVQNLLDATKGMKLIYLGFAVGAMIVGYAISNLFNIITVDDTDFIQAPKETIMISANAMAYEAFYALPDESFIASVNPSADDYYYAYLTLPSFFSVRQGEITQGAITPYLTPLDRLNPQTITAGRMAEAPFEMVVDEAWITKHIATSEPFNTLNITSKHDLLGLTMTVNDPVLKQLITVEIVGVSNTGIPVTYVDEITMIQLRMPDRLIFELFDDRLNLVAGKLIENDYEVMISETAYMGDPEDFTPLTIDGPGDITLELVGVYSIPTIDGELNAQIANFETIRHMTFIAQNEVWQSRYIYAEDVESTLEYLESLDIIAIHVYENSRQQYYQQQFSLSGIIFSIFAITASGISFYFIIRSSMINRIYEIGVYRSLGVKKWPIMKRFIYESIIITTCSSMIGYIIINYIIQSTQRMIGDITRIGVVSILSIATGAIFIYLVNVLSGLIPISTLLKKTPAQINTQYDL